MTWARFDDGFAQHPKIVGLSDQAFRLHVSAVCYANANLTDGLIQHNQLPLLLHGKTLRIVQDRARELVEAGVWDRAAAGHFQIHDFLIYNKPRSEVMARRQTNAKAGAKGAASRWHHNGNAPDPDPVPLLLTQEKKKKNAGAKTSEEWFKAVTKRSPHNDVFAGQLRDIDAAHPPECIEWGWSTAASKDDPWAYVKRLFDSCRLTTHGPREGKPYARANGAGQGHPAAAGRSGQVRRTSDFD